jgi:hypothetical protein
MSGPSIIRLVGLGAAGFGLWRLATGALTRHSLAEPGPAAPIPEAAAPAAAPAAPAPTPRKDPLEDLIAEQEAAARSEAGRIGGPHSNNVDFDPADHRPEMEAVYEAGGGYAEGYEIAEVDLRENASHGDGHADPSGDAFGAEAESDRSTVEYAEVDGQDQD